jgi:hypothetical protein
MKTTVAVINQKIELVVNQSAKPGSTLTRKRKDSPNKLGGSPVANGLAPCKRRR